jgi:hypothetical protein
VQPRFAVSKAHTLKIILHWLLRKALGGFLLDRNFHKTRDDKARERVSVGERRMFLPVPQKTSHPNPWKLYVTLHGKGELTWETELRLLSNSSSTKLKMGRWFCIIRVGLV